MWKNIVNFLTEDEELDMDRFETVGVIKSRALFDEAKLEEFTDGISALRGKPVWTKEEILELYYMLLPDFSHHETGKYLDQRM